jgi:general secretion pathway protein I
VEVLVALAVVALTIPALLFALDQQIDGTAYLRDRALARIVAVNRLSELRLGRLGGRPLLRGSASGDEEMAERLWYWRIDSESTDFPDLYRVSIRVSDSEEAGVTPLYTLVSLLTGDDDSEIGGES